MLVKLETPYKATKDLSDEPGFDENNILCISNVLIV